ncbi:MAG TPA: family 78 glycoside hydrolase catalytic domain [Propionibacteriaceae bacterium]|nr:family 78 glycoside hydrolase catalytic domain [Propionibacteriaceae bacterium]
MRISRLTVAGLEEGCVTDEPPRIAFALESEVPGEGLAGATITVGEWSVQTTDQVGTLYTGPLDPYTDYTVEVTATGTSGAQALAATTFRTGRLATPWTARWITDPTVRTPPKLSPVPMAFRHDVTLRPGIRRAWVEATALGVYELRINGTKAGNDYFAPGFTSYAHQIQYQTYDVTDLLTDQTVIEAVVAGGWAVGSFTHQRKSAIYADRQAFLCELHVEYEDGSSDLVATGPDWQVATDGPYRVAEWYDGETYDARVTAASMSWKPASVTTPRGKPRLVAAYGAPVRRQQVLTPVSRSTAPSGETVYDFGQNFAGVVSARLHGQRGQTVTFRHAEVLVDGELFTQSLRTAKATATYVCVDGEQEYSPRLTYMGFRYVGVRGIDPDDLELTALVLHSEVRLTGSFSCSNDLVNGLQHAIEWGGRSNFVDIPTDCPQRDEREGWTGDLAVFASTASFLFDTSRFYDKWLRDLSAEQGRGGGIPMVVPKAGNGFPTMATSCWGDACILVPWAEYLARGDLELLRRQYPTMVRFLRAARWWSGLFSVRPERRLVWRFPFHFGDWTSPEGNVKDWLARGKWIGTAYFANSCGIVARIADLLGKSEDAAYHRDLQARIARAYRRAFTDGHGRLADEFQTGYVLPLHFGMTQGEETEAMADNLVGLVERAGGHLSTGFPGTPYLLFALSDNGRLDAAYDLLLQTTSPSWLAMIVAGGTTIWERWDALRPDGTVNVSDLRSGSSEDTNGGMVSFNHYAAGAVGDWLYRRVAGLEPVDGGYRTFRVAPMPGGGLTWARASVETPYGRAASAWTITDDEFRLSVDVPVSTTCTTVLPDGSERALSSGHHELICASPRRETSQTLPR